MPNVTHAPRLQDVQRLQEVEARRKQPPAAAPVTATPKVAAQRKAIEASFGGAAQLAAEDEEPLQGKAIQRAEEEELLQGKAIQRAEEEEPLQGKAIQRAEEEEPLQGKAIQRAAEEEEPLQGKAIQRFKPESDGSGAAEAPPAQVNASGGLADASEELSLLNAERAESLSSERRAGGSPAGQAPAAEEKLPASGVLPAAARAAAAGASDREEKPPAQGKAIQRAGMEEEEPLQGKGLATAQREEQPNRTGMPDQLKNGIESLSGMSLNDVKVNYNSSKPSQLNAHAYAQGSDIHVAPGQEKHLPHEAWHTVQQKQGRVKPTMQMAGAAVNDDASLETEADVMGEKALQAASKAKTGDD